VERPDPTTPPKPPLLSAGVVVLRREGGAWRLLLLRCYQNWDFPKGLVEPGEAPLAAAVREVAEETTIADLAFRWGEAYRETEPYGRGKVARYYLAETSAREISLPVSPQLCRPEHDEWRWVGFGEAARMLPPRLQPILAWARQTVA